MMLVISNCESRYLSWVGKELVATNVSESEQKLKLVANSVRVIWDPSSVCSHLVFGCLTVHPLRLHQTPTGTHSFR
ncbi:Uncharacterized protein TCM_000891 [Theobroma cacao]|uniref:Uncharacterized protein n=1 Tax=Theobroma cacao TaxID=3641 RepID=A0A061DH89_THECC|nr:Uncharacterized protein TCM_000891 [Theobroma cacao]